MCNQNNFSEKVHHFFLNSNKYFVNELIGDSKPKSYWKSQYTQWNSTTPHIT